MTTQSQKDATTDTTGQPRIYTLAEVMPRLHLQLGDVLETPCQR